MKESNFIKGTWYLGTDDYPDKFNITILVNEEYKQEWIQQNLHTFKNEQVFSVEDITVELDGEYYDGQRIITQNYFPHINSFSDGGYLQTPTPANWRELKTYLIIF